MKLEEYTKKYGNKEADEKKLNELLGIDEDKVWRPQLGGRYWWVDGGGYVSLSHNVSASDNDPFTIGNCFQTKEQAQFEVDRRKFLALFERSLRENEEFEVDYNDPKQDKFDLYFNTRERRIRINCWCYTQSTPRRYTTTNEDYLQEFIEEHKEELIKYYFEAK